ncbi:MAG: arylsulfatase [Burkholderiales bacterium]|nr:arylsulfatase [Burkholderiales bacterium]MDE1926432.1 arylsulfatase [Burkholderiales bacterium]MDE2158498.1 arylsulfatase [Burkholderiales bacterium]MDE2503811.1 arylsulfatase [Burkholderiales bacterium]
MSEQPPVPERDMLPRPPAAQGEPPGRTPQESATPRWPLPPKPPRDAPNVLVILTDDIGYGASSTFGGPIPTPTLDALAAMGLRYTEFHTTAMCSPTRAALLTGRNHHEVGAGRITEGATAYDGYTSIIPRSAATIAELLRLNGYSTALIGKYHNVPEWETGPTGPFDHWPTSMGFEHFYGFLGGGTNQWSPGLYQGTQAIEPPRDDPDYILEKDLADQAIAWLHRQASAAPDKPVFMHYATASGHSPHHAPRAWIEKFKGRFDEGWDRLREATLARQKACGVVPENTLLTRRPNEIAPWESLSADERRLYARMIEVYAATVAHSDHQIGRVIEALREMGRLDNTLVVFIQGDNGASAEGGVHGEANELLFMNGLAEELPVLLEHIDELGGPMTYNHYPVGWAHAMDTPFQWFKQVASHFGGTRNGMVLAWPERIGDAGGVRRQFHHVIDIAPTILEAIGLGLPAVVNGVAQKPMSGVGMSYTFTDAQAPSARKTQYFELAGNRAIYHDGWVAASGPVEMPWAFSLELMPLDDSRWELYHVAQDYSEAVDLAAQEPERLARMKELFWIEAARRQVLPIMPGTANMPGPPKPNAARGRSEFVFYPGAVRLPPGCSPNVANRSFRIVADVELPAADLGGMLYSQGGRFGGHALYLLEGRLVYHYNLLGRTRFTVTSDACVHAGRHALALEFRSDGGGYGRGGDARLQVDGHEVGRGRIGGTVPWILSYTEGANVGLDTGTPVSEDYRVPFAFEGRLHSVTLNFI